MTTLRDSFQKAWRNRKQGKSGSEAQPSGDTHRQDEILRIAGFLEGHTKSSTVPVESYSGKRAEKKSGTPRAKKATSTPKSGKRSDRKRKPLPSPSEFDEPADDFDLSQRNVPSSKRVSCTSTVGFCVPISV